MGIPVTIKVHSEGKIKEILIATDYEITMDTMSTATSTFQVDTLKYEVKPMDFIIVEMMGDPYGWHRTEPNYIMADSSKSTTDITVPFYFGRVVSTDLTTITAMDAVGAICDQKVVERSYKGANPSQYLYDVYTQFVANLQNAAGSPSDPYWSFATKESGGSWTRTIQDAASVNYLDLMRNIQQYYQHTLTYGGFTTTVDSTGNIRIKHHMAFHNILNDLYSNDKYFRLTLDLNNAAKYDTDNVQMYIRPNTNSGVNVVTLVQKNKPTQYLNTGPKVVYFNDDGTFTVDNPKPGQFNNYPIVDMVVFEPHEDPNHVWTNDEYIGMAKQVTSIDRYSHTVDFDIVLNNPENQLDKRYTTLGYPILIKYRGQELESYISAYSYDSTKNTLHITAGNIRSDLPQYAK